MTINGATGFEDKAQVLRQAFFPDNDPPPQHQPTNSLEGFSPVTQEEVLKALEAIPPNSAPGDDTLPPSVWIRLHKVRSDILTHMADWSLRSRTLPTILKRVLTMVIPKPGKPDYSVPKAYRMISLLPTLSKTIEHVALARMTVFAPNCLSPLQFACRKGYSPLDAVHLILEKVHKASNDKLYSSALFLNVQGAFDKVLHQRLAEIMSTNNFPLYLVDWAQSYLSDRSVRITDGAASEPSFTPIQVGIPQGSPLSPFLFRVYGSPLCHNHQRLGVELMVSYVDDYCLLAISVSWQQNAVTLTAAGNQLQLEANQGGMNFDLSKTELCHFPCGKHLPTAELPVVQFGEHHIQNNLEQRWVGVFLDKTLRGTLHIEKRAAKAGTTLYNTRHRRKHPASTGSPTPQWNPPTPRRFSLLPLPQTGLPDSNLHKKDGLQINLSHFRPTRRLPGSIGDTTQQGPQTTNNQHSQLLQQAPEPQLENPRPTNTLA